MPPEVAANTRQWPLPHRDYAAHRAVLDARIFSGNVARLAVAWSVPINVSAGNFDNAACNPVILDNPVHFQNRMTIQPSVFNDTVYLGTLPGSQGCTGYPGGVIPHIFALDQATGEIRWAFSTIDSEDLWGDPRQHSGGGIWYPPSIDVVRGLVFAGTRNPAPWPGNNGASRPGPNLYTSSVVQPRTPSIRLSLRLSCIRIVPLWPRPTA